MISAVLFIVFGLAICVASVIGVLATVDLYYLSGSRAIADDGLPRGRRAPSWRLADTQGTLRVSPPPDGTLQLIVFADHSLRSFPSVAEGLRGLADDPAGPRIIVMPRHEHRLTGPTLEMLGLGGLPVVPGSPALYGKYNVRVMPFVIAVGADGRVRASSLVNHGWQVHKLWRLAQVAPEPGELAPARRIPRRPARAQV